MTPEPFTSILHHIIIMATKPSSFAVIDGLGLQNTEQDGTLAKTRIKDVKSALAIYTTLHQADRESSLQRARLDAMFDGAAPYDQAKLRASGQNMKTNLNFGEAQRQLDIALSAYVDLYSSLERFVDVRGTEGESNQRLEREEIVADEISHMLRSWPEFHSSYLRLCTTFIKHGVGVAYFDSPTGWRFRVGSFEDILIPRQSPATEEAVDVSVIRRSYRISELNHFIKNEKTAKKIGWNVSEVKRVMAKNVKTTGRGSYGGGVVSDFEAMQAELKNNDLYMGVQNPTVDVLHFLVREASGGISHYTCAESSPEAFMFQKVDRYQSAEDAFVMFSYGVGSNGTYHSVRGLGQRIFAHIQTSNRLRCQMVDGAMLGSAVMIQPDSQRALEELDFTFYGAYAVLSPNVNIIPRPSPNLGTAVMPALEDMNQQLMRNTDVVSSYGPDKGSPYRNEMQVVSDMDVATRLSGASLNLFYASWNRLMRSVVKRIVSEKNDPAIKELIGRCAERGVPESFIRSLDVDKTKAVRSIGGGSQANRMVALRELQGISGQFPESGRRNLTRDIVSTRVGHDLADRYTPREQGAPETSASKIAFFENRDLMGGRPVPVLSSEYHGAHLEVHLPEVEGIIEGLDSGEVDPVQALPALQAFYQHLGETVQFAAGDPALEGQVGYTKQVMQYAEEAINNTSKHLEKLQREQASQEQPEQPAQPEQPDPAQLAKMETHQQDMMMKRQKAELEMELKKRKFDEEQALRDAETALKFREENT